MPIIKFSAGDTLKNMIISDKGYYGLDIIKVESPFTSKTGSGSLNYKITFAVRDGKFTGKELTIIYNTNMNQGSILGGMQFEPTFKMLDLIAAVTGKPAEVGQESEFDIDDLDGKSVDGQIVVHASQDGGLVNIINGFTSLGKGNETMTAKTPF